MKRSIAALVLLSAAACGWLGRTKAQEDPFCTNFMPLLRIECEDGARGCVCPECPNCLHQCFCDSCAPDCTAVCAGQSNGLGTFIGERCEGELPKCTQHCYATDADLPECFFDCHTTGACPKCDPTAPESVCECGGKIKSDPHFTALDGRHYDVTGVANTTYSIVSDSGLAVNALFSTAYTTGLDAATGLAYHAKGTWMAAVGVVTPAGTLEVFANGTVAASPGLATAVIIEWPRVTVSTLSMDLEITAVPPFTEWGVPADEQADLTHFNLSFRRLVPGPRAHGLLGVTSRHAAAPADSTAASVSAPSAATGHDGEGVIEGVVDEYALAGLLSTDFKYSAYGTATPL